MQVRGYIVINWQNLKDDKYNIEFKPTPCRMNKILMISPIYTSIYTYVLKHQGCKVGQHIGGSRGKRDLMNGKIKCYI